LRLSFSKALFGAASAMALTLAMPAIASAQTDEIQVYTGDLAPVGVFNLTLHSNFTPSGINTPAFPGAVVADKSFNGVPEWAYGVTRWFEAGLYLPLYSRDDYGGGFGFNGWKLRALFAVPDAGERKFFYGANFEFSINQKRWDPNHFSSEVRPIVGWHLGQWDVVINPILDTEYDGLKNLDFAPSSRVAYNFSPKFALAAEEYADYGPLHDLVPASEQGHQLFGVFDYSGKGLDVEGGIGFGLTNATDNVTLKLILSHDFNQPRKKKPGTK
jgi:hypothetical protein